MNDVSQDNGAALAGRNSQSSERPGLPDAARRALAEAAERRRQLEAEAAGAGPRPTEVNGPKGPEPVRYGDWEKNGITSDF